MKTRILAIIPLAWALLAGAARADDFATQVDVTPLRTLSIQDEQTLKTLDSFARQTLGQITGHSSLDGLDPIYTVLDMCFRPENYLDRNIIRVHNAKLRQDFQDFDIRDSNGREILSADDRERILKQGTVSLRFMTNPDVERYLEDVSASAAYKQKAVGELRSATVAMLQLCQPDTDAELRLLPAAIIAPATDRADDRVWHEPIDVVGNVPELASQMKETAAAGPGGANPHAAMFTPLANYGDREPYLADIFRSTGRLMTAWRAQNADNVNAEIRSLADILPKVNPAVYPSATKRSVEVIYNRLTMMTIPGACFYFAAMVCFLMSARSGVGRLRLWGLRLMIVAFLIHSLGIGVRWWLVGSIPIKNEFESVMFCSWFGALIGLILELRKSRGMIAAAACFVGMLALVAIFSVPFVTGTEIGGNIGQANGVLMSYWLYIHVTMVTASYSMIGMGFMLSAWWLIKYYADYGTLRRVPANLLSADAARGFDGIESRPRGSAAAGRGGEDSPYPGGGAVALPFAQTLAMVFFQPRRPAAVERVNRAAEPMEAPSFLATLDLCNVVVLQLAFWVLGTGIVMGAIWADQSWGRPWGWDPKETFALVTWIVYLIVVHARVATRDKAWWTAVLSCVGFFIMLFNWIGVNYFLVGLHSYA